jgi:hypothetical protein
MMCAATPHSPRRVRERLRDVADGQRSREQKALRVIAPELAQTVQLVLRLDAFADRPQARSAAHRDPSDVPRESERR